jgi:DNA invertase Pin-like site-specific DNA recombinase
MRTAIYTRASSDRDGERLAVRRHEEDCRALCERKSWDVVGVYEDNDTSATNGKARPEYERMWADVQSGGLDAVVCWDVDRLTRTPREMEDVILLADRVGLELATVTGEIDLGTPTGRLTARIKGSVARMEIEQKSARQKRANVQSAQAGKVSGGGYRAFGYERDGVTADAVEADVVREMAKRLLAGESLNSVARGLAKRGIVTTAGNPWTPQSVKQTMTGVRLSGRREHLGEVVGEGVWPAIISVEDSDRLRMLLMHRPPPRPLSGAPRTYLLSGLLVCGKCGFAMVGKRKRDVPRYVCRTIAGTGRCGGIVTNAERTDELVRQTVLTVLASAEFAETARAKRNADPEIAATVERAQSKLTELAKMWADGELDGASWKTARETVQGRLAAAEKVLAKSTGPDPLGAFTGTYSQMTERWARMNRSQRRAVVDAVVEEIRVLPSGDRVDGRRDRFDPSRFDVTWRV